MPITDNLEFYRLETESLVEQSTQKVDCIKYTLWFYSPLNPPWVMLGCSHISLFLYSVNSEIFAMVLFSRNFANAKFREHRTLVKWRNHYVIY